MSTPDITKAISSNDIKNGASLLLVNKTGIEVLFDSSRDTEQGLEVLAPETTDRFNDRTYYFPSSTSSPGTSSTDTLDNVTDRGAITTNGITVGSLTLPASGYIISGTNMPQIGYRAVFTQDLYGNTETGLVSGSTVLNVGSNAQLLALLNPSTGYGNVQFLLYNNITITYSDNTTQTFSDCRCTNLNGSILSFGYGATTVGHNFPITLQTSNYVAATPAPRWTFGTDGKLTLPTSGSITFSNNTTQTSAGVPSNTGLVPNSNSINNIISISQTDYNNLITKNPNTLYIIN